MPHLVRGAGEHYMPLPNARFVEPHAGGDDPSDLEVFAPAGTPVHAVYAGTVTDGDEATIRIEGEDGHTYVYQTVQDRRVAPGERVDAGAIVGVIGAVGDHHVLRLAVTDRGNAPVRPHELLLGAVDPNELGYGPGGTGMDLDPDASAESRASRTAPVARRSAEAPKGQPSPKPQPTSTRQPPPKPQPAPKPQPSATRQVPPTPRPATPVRPAPTPSVGAVAPGRRRDPVPRTPDDQDQPETVEDQRPEPEPRGPATTDKKPPVVIPPPPPPVPLLDQQKDETDDEPSAPSATRSEEQQRKRAAMLIASRRRRPDDTGPKR